MDDVLHDTAWLLDGPFPVPGGVEVTIAFNDGNASGCSGCNRFRTSYRSDGDALEFGPMAGTLVMCSDDAMAVERDVLERLGRVAGRSRRIASARRHRAGAQASVSSCDLRQFRATAACAARRHRRRASAPPAATRARPRLAAGPLGRSVPRRRRRPERRAHCSPQRARTCPATRSLSPSSGCLPTQPRATLSSSIRSKHGADR